MKPFDPALLPHLTPAKRPLALGLVAGTAQGLLAVAQAFAIGALIVDLVTAPGEPHWHTPALWLVGIVLARALAGYVVDVSGAAAASTVSTVLRRRVLEASAQLDTLELSRHRTGELTTLATRGMSAVEPYLTRYLPSLVLAAVLPVATVAAIFVLDWWAGLVIVLTLPLVPVFAVLIGLNTRDRADAQWREMSSLAGHFLDVVRGLPTLVAHRRAGAQSGTIRTVTDRYRRATLDTLRIAFASSVALELIATISVALVAVTVGLRLANGAIGFETALVVLLLAPEAYWPWRRVGAEFHSAAEGTSTFTAATELIDRASATSAPAALRAEARAADAPQITLDEVGFTYPDRQRPALAPTSAVLPTRGLVAVTGPSGAGKSTLLALLAGELTPSTGVLTCDGTPLVADSTWRSQLAVAPQRPWLTADTIAANLRVASPGASDDDLLAALDQVALAGVVAGLPDGLQTPLGEDGAGLSAGQRARLALARVGLADRPVVLLDEPSAHLDAATERILLDTLQHLAATRLVVVVAHRESVVEVADAVVTVVAPSDAEPLPGTVALADRNDTAATTTPARPAVRSLAELPDLVPVRFGLRTGALLGAGSVLSGVALTATAAWLITRASEQPPVMMLMVAIVGVRAFGLARPVLRYAERLVSHDAAFRDLAERRASVYDALVPLVPGRLGVRRGDVLTSVVDDVDALVDEQLRVRQPRSTALVVALAATLLATAVAPVAGLVTGAVCTLSALSWWVTRRGAQPAEKQFVRARAELSTHLEDWFASVRQYVAWGATATPLARVDRASDRLGSAAAASVRASALGRTVVVVSTGLGLVAMASALDGVLATGGLSPAMTALLVMLPLALADALMPWVDAATVEVRTHAAHARLDALTAMTPAVVPATPDDLPTQLSSHPDVLLNRVHAGWGDQDAVRGLDLALPAGTRLGLVGPSGCGKSTVAALLMRFLDPRSGEVTYDQHPGTTLAPDTVRASVGLVDDDPYVFASSVLENVRLARPDASDADVRDALRRARLEEWTATLPSGVHTLVGEGNAHVSGGERARLALARALLADQPVLVLDEPTAHLDAATARQVTEELLAQQGRSVLWITHGTVGLDQMDAVVRMDATAARVPAGV